LSAYGNPHAKNIEKQRLYHNFVIKLYVEHCQINSKGEGSARLTYYLGGFNMSYNSLNVKKIIKDSKANDKDLRKSAKENIRSLLDEIFDDYRDFNCAKKRGIIPEEKENFIQIIDDAMEELKSRVGADFGIFHDVKIKKFTFIKIGHKYHASSSEMNKKFHKMQLELLKILANYELCLTEFGDLGDIVLHYPCATQKL